MFFQNRIITLAQAVELSKQLAEKVQEVESDIVISIESGGWFVGKEVAARLSVPHLGITVRRFSKHDKNGSVDNLSAAYRLFQVIWCDMLRPARDPKVISGIPGLLVKGKKILLIDDAVHTGKTILVAQTYLEKQGAERICVAALASVRDASLTFVHLLRGHYCYPWSRVSSEYRKFQELYIASHCNGM